MPWEDAPHCSGSGAVPQERGILLYRSKGGTQVSEAIQSADFDGAGMKRVYENNEWTVGIKNYKAANSLEGFKELERHNKTDELFVLLSGRCVLLEMYEESGRMHFHATPMRPAKVYTIPSGLWHTTITETDTKLVLIEDADTGMANSDTVLLEGTDLRGAREAVEAALSPTGNAP